MKQADIDKLLAGRQVVEDFEKVHPTPTEDDKWELVKGLQKVGFNSPAELVTLNHALNLQALKQCRPVIGVCTTCVPEREKRPCRRLTRLGGSMSIWTDCYPGLSAEESVRWHDMDRLDADIAIPMVYNMVLTLAYKGLMKVTMDPLPASTRNPNELCPPDNGYHVDTGNSTRLPFDVNWSRRF